MATIFRKGLSWVSEIRSVAYRAGLRHAALLMASFLANLARLKWLALRTENRDRRQSLAAISLLENFGDLVACEPVGRHLREKYPDAFVLWFVRKPYAELVKFNPHIDRVITLSCLTEWIWLSRFKMFDQVVDLHLPRRVCTACKIPLAKELANVEITFDNYYNFGSLLTAFSQSAGLPALNEAPRVYIPDAVRQRVDQKTSASNFVVFHCESYELCRDWPAEKWKELAEKVTANCALPIVEVGTTSLLARTGLNTHIDLCGKLSLLETAEVIRRATLFVGIDSGPAHLANALGVSGIVLLGRYHSFERYLPYSGNYADPSKAQLIYGDGPAASIDVEKVFLAIHRNLRLDTAVREVA